MKLFLKLCIATTVLFCLQAQANVDITLFVVVSEADGTATATVTYTGEDPSTDPVSPEEYDYECFDYETRDGTAIGGVIPPLDAPAQIPAFDYESKMGYLEFDMYGGVQTEEIIIPIVEDLLVESYPAGVPHENFFIDLFHTYCEYDVDPGTAEDPEPVASSEIQIDDNDTTFVVTKDYIDNIPGPDDNPGVVTVDLVCTSGNVVADDATASENPADTADFTVNNFTAGTTCTGTENPVPTGYSSDEASSCLDTAIVAAIPPANGCTITNTQNPATLTVYVTGGGPVGLDIACTDGSIPSPMSSSASEGSPAVFTITNFPWDGAACTVTPTSTPPGTYVTGDNCTGVGTVLGDVALDCAIAIAETRATFHVVKGFSDDNPMEVAVTLSCNTGLPLEQTKMVVDDNTHTGGVDFVVVDFDTGELDCVVTEEDILGYVPDFTNRSASQSSELDDEGCFYEDVLGGADNSCFIKNELQQVEIEVTKIWFDDHPDFNNSTYAKARWYCDDGLVIKKAVPDDTQGSGGCYGYDECGSLHFYGTPSVSSFSIYPHYDGTYCHVSEKVYDSGVESDDSDCYGLWVYPGIGADCEIINTRYYEGIPTLSQYGLAILALLMLGVGMVGFRRFI